MLKKLENSNKENDSLSIEDYKLCFEKSDFKLKSKYFDSDESIFLNYDYKQKSSIDSLQTHPDCSARIQLLTKKLDKENKVNISKTIFFEFKKNSINQNLINLFNKKDYGICLYESLKIYKKNPKNSFLKNIISLN